MLRIRNPVSSGTRTLLSCAPPTPLFNLTSAYSESRGFLQGCSLHTSTHHIQRIIKDSTRRAMKPTLLLTQYLVAAKNDASVRRVTTLSPSAAVYLETPSPITSRIPRAIMRPLLSNDGTLETSKSKAQGVSWKKNSPPKGNNIPYSVWKSPIIFSAHGPRVFVTRPPLALTESGSLAFPPPTSTISKGSETLPFLDFRTDNSREVFYTKCDEEADNWLKSSTTRMWALDAEWRPFIGYGKQGRIALIQLGNDETIYLFHVIHMKRFPEQLAHILEDQRVLKVGINIRNDGTKIMKDWGVGCANLVELGALSIQVQDNLVNQRKIRSMDRLAKELLGHTVEKVALTRMGNWESKYLTASQLAYAANDAFVTYEVAERIKYLQNAQPSKDYVIPLATIQEDGASVVTVRGTLQEREDAPATTKDIVVNTKKVLSIANRTRWPSGLKASSILSKFTNTTSLSAVRPPPPRTTSAVSKIFSRKGAKFSVLESEPDIFHGNHADAETKHAIQFGGRSVVTIIRPNQQQRRSFSHASCMRTDSNGNNDDLSEIRNRMRGDIYVPSEILPESLEGKDILERNQAVWQEAGGRELSEETDNRSAEDDDWYLRQNQALLESLATNSTDGSYTRKTTSIF